MKNRFHLIGIFTLLSLFFLSSMISSVHAQVIDNTSVGDLFSQTGTEAGFDPSTDAFSIAEMAGAITFAALSLLGVIFITLIVYAGFLWMTARGNNEQVSKAKEILTTAVIGVFIVMGAYAFTAFIYRIF